MEDPPRLQPRPAGAENSQEFPEFTSSAPQGRLSKGSRFSIISIRRNWLYISYRLPGNYFPKKEETAAKLMAQNGSDWQISDVATFKKEAYDYEYKKETPKMEPRAGKTIVSP